MKGGCFMLTIYTCLIIFEVFLAAFAAWCILNESRLIAFEEKISHKIRTAVLLRTKKRAAEKRRRINARVRYTPEVPQKLKTESQNAA